MPIQNRRLWAALIAVAFLARPLVAQDEAGQDLTAQEEAAWKAAVNKVDPSVVRIETVGGLERIGQVLFGTGPTTGLVVSEDGYVISSAFNFAQKPASILVGLPDGTRAPAQVVATDHARMLVLLKVQIADKLTPPEVVPADEIQVGQWSLAVGRTFAALASDTSKGVPLNVSKGIISATDRMHGRAVQTDAKVSPANYGGPLVDISGRVQGVLVPLSPQGNNQVAGVEWYDSGIAFAIPMEDVMQALPRLKEGQDLHPGIMGISMRQGNQFADPAVIAVVRANSPAYSAGFKTGDKIVEIDGKKIVRQMNVFEALGPHYAGDVVKVAVLRGEERIEKDLKLIDKLLAYDRPFLGVAPLRVARDEEEAAKANPGAIVRHVFADSGADNAGLKLGDRVLAVNGEPVADANSLRERVSSLHPGEKAKLDVQRGEEKLALEVQLGRMPEAIPAELPPAVNKRPPYIGERAAVGYVPIKIPEFENDAFIYVPGDYDPAAPHGLLVWLHESNGLKEEPPKEGVTIEPGTVPAKAQKLIDDWKPHCERSRVILVVPKSANPGRWDPAKEVQFVAKVIEQVKKTYNVDDRLVAAHGYQSGAAMAYSVAFDLRAVIRGVAAIDAPLPGPAPENEPVNLLAFYVTRAEKGRTPLPVLQGLIAQLRAAKFPVVEKDFGEQHRYLSETEKAELARWLDSLDSI